MGYRYGGENLKKSLLNVWVGGKSQKQRGGGGIAYVQSSKMERTHPMRCRF